MLVGATLNLRYDGIGCRYRTPTATRCSSLLSLPRAIPIVWKPILDACCTARWPSPARPSTATSPGRAPLWRSASKVVRPAHLRDAASTRSRPASIRATALADAKTSGLRSRFPRRSDVQGRHEASANLLETDPTARPGTG